MFTQTAISNDSGITTVKFTGRITQGSSLSLAEAQLNQLVVNQGVVKIIFDLTDVDFIDSAGLGFIVLLRGKLKDKGGQLRLANPNPRVLELFRLTHTDGFLEIDADTHESIDKMNA